MLEGITCKFENLREGGLIIDFGQRSSVLSLVSLLKFAPHIEHLYIRVILDSHLQVICYSLKASLGQLC